MRDYRDQDGLFDAVVSVEMIEAVGEEFWPEYFQKIDSLLAPGGKAAIQAILIAHDRLVATRNTYTWIHKYIFPGGMLPSTDAIGQVTRKHTSLHVSNIRPMGLHYAHTLRMWREQWKYALLVAAVSPVSYVLVLYAVQQAPISHVAPAREVSMLFAALIGGHLLREGDRLLRLLGALFIAAGVVALAMG